MGGAVSRERAPAFPGDWMPAAVRCIPGALLGGAGERRLMRCLRLLPPSAGENGLLFEVRLGERERAADLSLSVWPHTDFAGWLVARGEADGASPASRGLARYLGEVGRPDGFLARWLAYAGLEYDLSAAGAGGENLPTPGVFLGSRFDNLPGGPPRGSARWRHGNPGVMTAAICQAVGWEEDDRERRHVQLLCDLMPPSAFSSHVGAMPGRELRAIRLVWRLPAPAAAAAADWLQRAEWPGPADLAGELAAEAASFGLMVSLAFDVNENGLLPRLGLELFTVASWRAPPPLWYPYLGRLVARGLCRPEKERGLRRWPRRELLFTPGGARRLVSGISHLKLVLSGGSVSAKAYPLTVLASTP